ncbi:MAG: replication-associated recombination protein A [Deltaproteobacteria bacterium]|nr:replication-associated recombination protein A [Deltaproteobacteria bacterium]
MDLQSPLAQRLRPTRLDEIVGQKHFLNEQFKRLLESDRWTGFIFWGPPGTGKTTLAQVIAEVTHRPFHAHSAVTSGVKDFREVLDLSRQDVRSGHLAHILFIDEVHRLNKAQQDVLLPFLEAGSIRFIGATTENPSFEINNAICSRCVIFHFNPLSNEELLDILKKAASSVKSPPEVLDRIAAVSLGDARRALTLLEHLMLSTASKEAITLDDFERLSHSQSLYYDKKSESHYDTISAFIKSVRGSDPDAAVYYLARMLEAGEDPLFIARRLIILASEDIGNANPLGLVVAMNAFSATHAIGMPEARIILAQAATYLACSEKSNRSYLAIEEALDSVRKMGPLEIPYSIRNAPTRLMKEWGYGKEYQYAHDFDGAWTALQFLPDTLKDRRYYQPSNRGTELKFQQFLKLRGKKLNE